jgi:8-oxo-dGTP diphosphatase
MKKTINVAAAVIYANGLFLLSKRLDHQHQGGKWEFPGGKIEESENTEQALLRELKEELNIDVLEQSHFMSLSFEYPEKHVNLHFQLVTQFDGKEQGNEGQQVQWFTKAELITLTFPDANVPVVDKIQQQL